MITVNMQKGAQVKVASTGTVLASLEAANVEHVSHCRSGYCGACRCKKKSGSVQYVTEPLGFMRPDEILPCISIADGDLELEV